MVDLLERIDVLLKQELTVYKTVDYLAPEYQNRLLSSPNPEGAVVETSSVGTSSSSSSISGINEFWREKICEWSYQVIDHFDFSREVVSISIHFLDRFLATRAVNKKMFQLSAMTTLFLAIKLNEPGRISMSSMIELSRGYFMVEQMAAMEMSILRALSWQVHPPTAYCFCKHVLFLLPYSIVSMDVRHDILELARFLTELSVIDYYFVVFRPSSVAMAALIHALEEIPGVSEQAYVDFLQELRRVPGLDPSCSEVQDCRSRLRLLYAQGGYSRGDESRSDARTETVSPVCVSHGVNQFHQPHDEVVNEQQQTKHNDYGDFTRASDVISEQAEETPDNPGSDRDNITKNIL